MSAQDYSKRIAIQVKGAATRSASGAVVQSWTTFQDRWAKPAYQGGREFEAARQVNPEVTAVWTVRAPCAATPLMRVVYGTREFAIVSVDDLSDRHEVRLICREGKSAQ